MDDARKAFEEFQRLPKGAHIIDPTDLIFIECGIAFAIREITQSSRVCLSRLSLKHLAEKGEKGKRLFHYIPAVLEYPDEIRKSRELERLMVIKSVDTRGRPQTIILHIDSISHALIITSFSADPQYLKNFDLLWRAATLPEG
jgi:hypothetical protein